MNLIYGQELPAKIYNWYVVSPKEENKIDPFTHFEKKFGYKPTRIGIGGNVEIDIPNGMAKDKMFVTASHIALR
jgi:hypothetical protein